MATANELVLQAYREINLIPLGDILTDDQVTEGLNLLDRYLRSLYGFDLGEFKIDWTVPPAPTSPVSARYPISPASETLPSNVWPYPPSNVNVLLSLSDDTTIYLQQNPDDGARVSLVNVGGASSFNLTVDGNGRLVGGLPTLIGLAEDLNQTNLLYRADMGDWTILTDMAIDTESPLPREYDTLLSLGVADRLAPRYGRSLNASQALELQYLTKRLRTQYRQTVPEPSASPQPFRSPASNQYGTVRSGDGRLF